MDQKWHQLRTPEMNRWIEMNEFSYHLQSQIISNHLCTVVASKLQPNKVGERRQIVVPPNLGYGNRNIGPIPAGSTLPSLNGWHATGIFLCQPRVLWNSTWIQHHGLPTAHLRLYFDVELKSIVTRWASKFRPTCRLPWKLQNFRAEMSGITQPSSHNCFLHLSAWCSLFGTGCSVCSFWHIWNSSAKSVNRPCQEPALGSSKCHHDSLLECSRIYGHLNLSIQSISTHSDMSSCQLGYKLGEARKPMTRRLNWRTDFVYEKSKTSKICAYYLSKPCPAMEQEEQRPWKPVMLVLVFWGLSTANMYFCWCYPASSMLALAAYLTIYW